VETIKGLIGMAVEMSARYFPALMRVMLAGVTPFDAMNLTDLDCQVDADENSTEVLKC
jgi:hypothetical protein